MAARLWLIGMMGSGKTAVGEIVAARLGMSLIDTDYEIVSRLGSPVIDLWTAWGEEGFRRVESEEVVRAAMAPPAVIATGGGAVMAPQNVSLMRRTGVVVWLEASVTTLAARTSQEGGRPLLSGSGPAAEEKLERILLERESAYRAAAHYRVSTEDSTPEEAARAVIAVLET